jgi:aryl-alcohol dehydrogenase-like predicted oxidoreductase
MRLPIDDEGRHTLAVATITAADAAGIVIFDTAHAYGADAATAGQNERLVATALRRSGAGPKARIVTKGGMTRAGDQWIPDGRARTIRTDCEASLTALDGLPIDLYLVHAPDSRTPWRTTLRALAELRRDGLARQVGVANVNRRQLEEALDVVEIAAVQVALSVLDDTAVRGGLVEFCEEHGIAMIAHSPLGGPRRAGGIARREALLAVAKDRGVTPQEVALAWVLDVSPCVVAIPGARRPETARSAARAAAIGLTPDDRQRIGSSFAWPQRRSAERPEHDVDGEVVMVMGIPGSGKSQHAEDYTSRGYVRLNRDERGGSLRDLNAALDSALDSGSRRIVLDNTYLTRASRSHVIELAARHHLTVRCVWIDTPLAQAQVNMVERLLDRFGSLPDPESVRALARSEPGILLPTNQMRAYRELEPPSNDEGFAAVEHVPFVREAPRSVGATGGVFVATSAMSAPGWELAVAGIAFETPCLLFDWEPGGGIDALDADAARLSEAVRQRVTTALCAHPAGPPVCWCRPPLPGLIQAFARTRSVDMSRSILVGTGPAHRTLAKTIGATYVSV